MKLCTTCIHIHHNLRHAYTYMTPQNICIYTFDTLEHGVCCRVIPRSSMSAKEPYITAKEPRIREKVCVICIYTYVYTHLTPQVICIYTSHTSEHGLDLLRLCDPKIFTDCKGTVHNRQNPHIPAKVAYV